MAHDHKPLPELARFAANPGVRQLGPWQLGVALGTCSRKFSATGHGTEHAMLNGSDERERPTEWLRELAEERGNYAELVRSSQSFAEAAYRIASARLRVQPTGAARVPTAAELRVAAAEICRRTGLTVSYPVAQLAADCEQAGLPVITPLSGGRAA
jgi:hypothetical protein